MKPSKSRSSSSSPRAKYSKRKHTSHETITADTKAPAAESASQPSSQCDSTSTSSSTQPSSAVPSATTTTTSVPATPPIIAPPAVGGASLSGAKRESSFREGAGEAESAKAGKSTMKPLAFLHSVVRATSLGSASRSSSADTAETSYIPASVGGMKEAMTPSSLGTPVTMAASGDGGDSDGGKQGGGVASRAAKLVGAVSRRKPKTAVSDGEGLEVGSGALSDEDKPHKKRTKVRWLSLRKPKHHKNDDENVGIERLDDFDVEAAKADAKGKTTEKISTMTRHSVSRHMHSSSHSDMARDSFLGHKSKHKDAGTEDVEKPREKPNEHPLDEVHPITEKPNDSETQAAPALAVPTTTTTTTTSTTTTTTTATTTASTSAPTASAPLSNPPANLKATSSTTASTSTANRNFSGYFGMRRSLHKSKSTSHKVKNKIPLLASSSESEAESPASSSDSQSDKSSCEDTSSEDSGSNSESDMRNFAWRGPKREKKDTTQIDLAISIDTTESMLSYWKALRVCFEGVATRLLNDIPCLRIALLVHGDYCDYKLYVVKTHDFGQSVPSMSAFLHSVEPTSGGDISEAYELMLREATKLSWRNSAKKILIVVGDSHPHPPSYTTQQISWQKELHILRSWRVKIYAAHVQSSEAPDAKLFFSEMARRTHSWFVPLYAPSQMADLLLSVSYREFQRKGKKYPVEANPFGRPKKQDSLPELKIFSMKSFVEKPKPHINPLTISAPNPPVLSSSVLHPLKSKLSESSEAKFVPNDLKKNFAYPARIEFVSEGKLNLLMPETIQLFLTKDWWSPKIHDHGTPRWMALPTGQWAPFEAPSLPQHVVDCGTDVDMPRAPALGRYSSIRVANIVVCGVMSSGKTYLIQKAFQLDDGFFFPLKRKLNVDGIECSLVINEFDKFDAVAAERLASAHVVIVVYAVDNASSFDTVPQIVKTIRIMRTDGVPILIVCNKIDMPHKQSIQGLNISRSHHAQYLECSAKSNVNTTECFCEAIRLLRKRMLSHVLPKREPEHSSIVGLEQKYYSMVNKHPSPSSSPSSHSSALVAAPPIAEILSAVSKSVTAPIPPPTSLPEVEATSPTLGSVPPPTASALPTKQTILHSFPIYRHTRPTNRFHPPTTTATATGTTTPTASLPQDIKSPNPVEFTPATVYFAPTVIRSSTLNTSGPLTLDLSSTTSDKLPIRHNVPAHEINSDDDYDSSSDDTPQDVHRQTPGNLSDVGEYRSSTGSPFVSELESHYRFHSFVNLRNPSAIDELDSIGPPSDFIGPPPDDYIGPPPFDDNHPGGDLLVETHSNDLSRDSPLPHDEKEEPLPRAQEERPKSNFSIIEKEMGVPDDQAESIKDDQAENSKDDQPLSTENDSNRDDSGTLKQPHHHKKHHHHSRSEVIVPAQLRKSVSEMNLTLSRGQKQHHTHHPKRRSNRTSPLQQAQTPKIEPPEELLEEPPPENPSVGITTDNKEVLEEDPDNHSHSHTKSKETKHSSSHKHRHHESTSSKREED
ncbi:von willebrand factor type A domain protein [Pelomyxa schiedti]|nr:von willebrand factor type A domain protein [Pelomyxa schiedti]